MCFVYKTVMECTRWFRSFISLKQFIYILYKLLDAGIVIDKQRRMELHHSLVCSCLYMSC